MSALLSSLLGTSAAGGMPGGGATRRGAALRPVDRLPAAACCVAASVHSRTLALLISDTYLVTAAEFITNEPALKLARRLNLLSSPEQHVDAPTHPRKKARGRSSSPASSYPTHVPTAGRPPAGTITAPAAFAAAASIAAAATVCQLPATLLADAAQLVPAAIAAGIGGALLLIAFNNITDYHTNFAMVEHVLAMDAMIPALGDITVKWRAVTSSTLHHLAYAAIIVTESTIGTLCTAGAYKQATAVDKSAKLVALDMTLVGLGLGFLLFFVGFVMVGAEWWYMWGSENFNGQIKAFHWSTVIILAILVHAPLRIALG
eukprot:COSAG02_NODE_701_length_18335_cov_18.672955_6_plen_318_part_00